VYIVPEKGIDLGLKFAFLFVLFLQSELDGRLDLLYLFEVKGLDRWRYKGTTWILRIDSWSTVGLD
jgi:hypothetical protein